MTLQEFQKRYTYNPVADKLGEGGYGTVFKAYDTYRSRWVALKISEVDPQYENFRLSKEVEMVSGLPDHPNIAYYEKECHTFPSSKGEEDFAILQYYEDGNLSQLLKNHLLTAEQKQSILIQILEGIDFLHNNGIIHRDLKPQNILIAKWGDKYIPKITDFGISKQLDANKSSGTNTSQGAGTRSYASPEQLGEREIHKNTDLWSFGVIAFQVLSGQLPFTSGEHSLTSEEGRIELFRQISSGKLPDSISQIPTSWQTAIRQCLVIDVEKRLKNTQEVKRIFIGDVVDDRIVVEGNVVAHENDGYTGEDEDNVTTRETITTERLKEKPRPTSSKPPIIKYVLIAVVVGVLLFGGWLFFQHLESRSHTPEPDYVEVETIPLLPDSDPEPQLQPQPHQRITPPQPAVQQEEPVVQPLPVAQPLPAAPAPVQEPVIEPPQTIQPPQQEVAVQPSPAVQPPQEHPVVQPLPAIPAPVQEPVVQPPATTLPQPKTPQEVHEQRVRDAQEAHERRVREAQQQWQFRQ